jgi:solute carrier family 44 protein 1 (choline transporter-like protein)/choline transporter-like protein 2/4/5
VFVPVFQAALVLGLWAGCLVAMAYLVSAANFTVANSTAYFTTIADYGDSALIRFYIFIFGTLWANAFFGAMGTFVIASACCMWYYSHAPGSDLSLPIWRSYKMLFKYFLIYLDITGEV